MDQTNKHYQTTINLLNNALQEKIKELEEIRCKLIKADEAFLKISKLAKQYKPSFYQMDVDNIIYNYLNEND